MFEPGTYTLRIGRQKTFLRIRKEPFGCSIFDNNTIYECNKSFYFMISKIIASERSSIVKSIKREYRISKKDAVKGYNAFIEFFIRKKWITSEEDLDKVMLLDYKALPPLELDTVYNMAPNSIDYHITLRCNLACPHCNFYEKMKRDEHNPELSTAEWITILQQLDANGCMQILITGGEPLIRKDVLDIVDHVMDKTGLFTIINTNGILWTRDQVKQCSRTIQDRGKIIISLDGHTPQTYGTARRLKNGNPAASCFDKVVETAHWIQEHNTRLEFILVLSKVTYAHSLKTVQWALEQFPRSYMTVLRFDVTDLTKKGLALTYKAWKDWLYAATPVKKMYGPRFNLGVAVGGELFVPFKNDKKALKVWRSNVVTPLTSEMYRLRRDVGCHAAVTDISLAPDGKVYGCGLYTGNPRWYVGDLTSDTFYDIWHYGEPVRKFRDLSLNQIEGGCKTCPVVELCGGGCRGRALVTTGSMYAPDPYCPYTWRETT
jgi:radical SAM protein with 4Fe4S-binding SPASM domain